MKTLIVALNSKFIHASLAPRYLKANCSGACGEVQVREFTINDNIDRVLTSIYDEKADIVAFSCYIWNVEYAIKLARNLKMIKPETTIIFGGPEVSFDSVDMLEHNKQIDFIISGEGETSFSRLIEYLNNQNMPHDYIEQISNLTFRKDGKAVSNAQNLQIEDLDRIKSPYTEEMLQSTENKIIYFEASRGCPFSCSYCLSSTTQGVRYFSLERVYAELQLLVKSKVRQIKFVDRTFNCNRERAKEIFLFIIKLTADSCKLDNMINFHFEVAGDLFDDEMLEILSSAPVGLIQLEIGVQTCNEKTLDAINRKTDIEKVFQNAKLLIENGNIHVHLDLIAGLPYEGFESFKNSFNQIYSLAPHHLQLGFLKLLKGSRIRWEEQLYGYLYRDYPPYEVLSNKYITFEEISLLKGVEELVERYYNSARFINTLKFVLSKYGKSAFDFYLDFHIFSVEKDLTGTSVSARELYSILGEFLTTILTAEDILKANELMKLDFLASDKSRYLPSNIKRAASPSFNDECFGFLKNEENVKLYLPEFIGLSPRQIIKKIHFETINVDNPAVYLFNYDQKDKVTGLYKYRRIKL